MTSARRVRQGYGADHGVPDLLVSRNGWAPGCWIGIEVKREGPVKWSHPRQEELWKARRTVVARSLEEACYGIWSNRVLLGHTATLTLAKAVPGDRQGEVVFGH